MSRVDIHIRNKRLWQIQNGIYVCGNAFEGQEFKDNIKLSELFGCIRSKADFLSTIQHLNGFYAVVIINNNEVYAVVDRIRSIPLFYGTAEGNVFISDDAHWVRDQVKDKEFAEIAETEFLLTGYVTGPDTLYPNVKQIQAGEALFVEYGFERAQISTERYYRYIHHYQLNTTEQELLNRYDKVLLNTFGRLIRRTNGRLIAVPLSGGYDSRLILLMLKRLGYENVIAFSYGREGNEDSKISKEVAQNINIIWEFVPYSNEAWYRWFHSEERQLYYRMADGLSSVPHIQDWPAVWEMKKDDRLPEDVVFVPGHAADILSGRHIPFDFVAPKYIGENQFVETIWKKHYNLLEWDKRDPHLSAQLWRRVIDRTECDRFDSLEDVASAIEKWAWQERLAKFLVNSIRVYEFFRYEWWLPYLDIEYLSFWSRVPLQLRIMQRLYNSYVQQLSEEIVGIDLKPAKKPGPSDFIPAMKKITCKMGFYSQAYTIYSYMKRAKMSMEYDNHPLAFYGMIPKKQFSKLCTGQENINSFLALERLGRISFAVSEDHS